MSLFAGISPLAQGQTNYWTKPGSGYWEEPYWSLGELPSMQYEAIAVRNNGWKAAAIGSSTTISNANSLSIRNLIVDAPVDSSNQLLLNYPGLTVPLNIAGELTVGPNGSLVSYYAKLHADSFFLNGPASFTDLSEASFGTITVGAAVPGDLSFSNATLSADTVFVGGAARGTVNQSGGRNEVPFGIMVNAQSSYTISGGSLSTGELDLEQDGAGGLAQFNLSGGTVQVDGTVALGRPQMAMAGAEGDFLLSGGSLTAATINVDNGIFTQSGGTNQAQAVNVPRNGDTPLAEYHLSNGALISQDITLGGYSSGTMIQSGGVHRNSGTITAWGFDRAGGHTIWGRYELSGGELSTPRIWVNGGGFGQEAGTNEAQEVRVDQIGAFGLRGGTLLTSNVTVVGDLRGYGSTFSQTGGVHTVQNQLLLGESSGQYHFGDYVLTGGTLNAPDISVIAGGELRLLGGTINNTNIFRLAGGFVAADGQHELGVFDLSNGSSRLDLQNGSTVLRFKDSHSQLGSFGTLSILNWSGSANGGGTDQIFIGTNAQGYDRAQLSRLTFVNPGGLPAGNYPARILSTGEIVPGSQPSITFSRSQHGMELTWSGFYQLYSATNVTGPYEAVSGASSPYTVSVTDPQRFFVLRPQ